MNGMLLLLLHGFELCAVVQKHDALLLDGEYEIGLAISIYVCRFCCYRSEVLAVAVEGWPHINMSMRCIPSRLYDDFNMPVKVDNDKMRWVGQTVSKPDNCIKL